MAASNMGFSFDSSNQLLCTTNAVDSNSRFVNGFAFDTSGNLHVSDSSPASTDPFNMGLRFKPTGELYITTSAPTNVRDNGLFKCGDDGRAYFGQSGTIAVYRRGVGFTSTGIVVATGLNPIPGLSPAAYFKFNTGITVTGSGVSQWDDQSGNGRHLKQGTDTNRPAQQVDGSILFDGSDNYLKCDAFTLNQPVTIYVRAKIVTGVTDRYLWDGNNQNQCGSRQASSGVEMRINSGADVATTGAPITIGAYFTSAAVYNGASSSIQINAGSPFTGNVGASNAAGFTLGSRGDGTTFANIQVKEVAVFAAAHDATTRTAIISYLSSL